MSTWLIVWFVIGIVSTLAVLACLAALIRHLMVLGRTARRMQEELAPVVREISNGGSRAGARVSEFGSRR